MDAAKLYQKAYMEIVQRRFWTMVEGLGLELSPNPLYDFHYGLIDFEFWARKNIGADAVETPWFISCETRHRKSKRDTSWANGSYENMLGFIKRTSWRG